MRGSSPTVAILPATGARPNQVMASVAKSLDDEQVKALATYYGSLPKPKARK
jgi:cytochrome c553